MLILHTSDWHLGRTFHGVDILDVQARAMEEIVGWVRQYGVDVVLVSGDVYDRAQPRTEVVELLNSTLADLRDAGARVILTSGNHDSPARLGFGSQIMAHGGVFLLTSVAGAARPVLLTQTPEGSLVASRVSDHADVPPVSAPDTTAGSDRSPVGATTPGASPSAGGSSPTRPVCTEAYPSGVDATVAVYGIPYLEPRSTAAALGCAATHQAVMRAVMERIDADRQSRGDLTSVVMAHAFVTGAQSTESERIVDSGGLGTVSADLFAGHDYTALGHIHRRQRITSAVRYSGSPVAYSFSEAAQPKGAWLVTVERGGVGDVVALDHEAGLRLARLRGPLDTLLEDSGLAPHENAWCQVVLTDPERPAAAMERVRTRFPRTVELTWEPEGGRRLAQRAYGSRLDAASSTEELCAQFYEHVRSRALTPEESADIADAVSAVRSRGAEQ